MIVVALVLAAAAAVWVAIVGLVDDMLGLWRQDR